MKYKVLLIIISILIVFGISLGIAYKFTNKNNDNKVLEVELKEDESTEDNITKEEVPKEIEEEKEVVKEENKQEIKKEEKKENISKKDTSTKKEEVKKVEEKKETETPKVQEEKVEEQKTEPVKTIVKTETIKEESSEPVKYGVVLKEIKTYLVTTYSDGTTLKKLTNTTKKYDKSGYSATTDELKEEATTALNNNKKIYEEVVGYVNTYRKEVDAPDIVLDDKLSLAATIRAVEIAYSGKFDASHKRPNGTSCFTVLSDLKINFSIAGENIAEGYSNAKNVSLGWKDSEGHYKNMISKKFSKIGVGMFQFAGEKYWVQIFTN